MTDNPNGSPEGAVPILINALDRWFMAPPLRRAGFAAVYLGVIAGLCAILGTHTVIRWAENTATWFAALLGSVQINALAVAP